MPAQVTLHLYDLVEMNTHLRCLGVGAFHAGVEVYLIEYSYGATIAGSGITTCEPMRALGCPYRESVEMGHTALSPKELRALIRELGGKWRGVSYDLLRQNCITFAAEFCRRLGVDSVPPWVTALPRMGACLGDGVVRAVHMVHSTVTGGVFVHSQGSTKQKQTLQRSSSIGFRIGDMVEGQRGPGKRWHVGSIADILPDGSFVVSWEDGNPSNKKKAADEIRRRPWDFSWLDAVYRSIQAAKVDEQGTEAISKESGNLRPCIVAM